MTEKERFPKQSVFEHWRQEPGMGNPTPYWLREPTEEEKRTHDRLDDLQRNGHAALPGPPVIKGSKRTRSWHT